MPEENVECMECGKKFSDEEFLEDHVENVHAGESLQVPASEYEMDMPSMDRKFWIGAFSALLAGLLVLGMYSLGGELLQDKTVDVTVVSCEECNWSSFRETTDRLFEADYREVDYNSTEGQKLVDKYNLYYVPGFIFEKSVENRENFTNVKSVLVEFDDAYVLPDRGNEAAQRMSEGKSLE